METIKDTTFINALLPLLAVIFIIGVGVVVLYQHFQKNLYMQKLKQETLKNLHQSELLRNSIDIQEEERKHIAQDLHDELGAVLSIMRMNIVMLEQQDEKNGGALHPGLQNVRHLSETALTSVRNISHRIMPPQLAAFGLVKTLEAVTEQINNGGNINIRLDVLSPLADLSWAIKLGLYRILMELINNTIKHADATQIDIQLSTKSGYVVCQYKDNGKGLSDADINKGMGHKSIDGRINALEGVFNIENGKDGGVSAHINIPVRE